MKQYKQIVFVLFVLMLGMLTACGKTETKEETSPAAISILRFNDDADSAELIAYFEDGKVPKEVNILYDQMGSNPEITLTDNDTIKELYRLLSMVEVSGKSNMSITDCYHHIRFKLAENHYVYYSFEGSEIWCYGGANYNIQNSSKLFTYMREITDEYCQQKS